MKPATPLPWVVDDEAQICGANRVVAQCLTFETSLATCDADAAYLCHAANAYPRLIEVLKECVTAAGIDCVEDFSRVSNAADKALSLLKELGE